MDGFEWNKIVGAILATLLLLFVLNEAASIAFHKEEPKQLAYKLELGSEPAKSGQEAKPEKIDFGRLLAAANAGAGEAVARRCLQCHTFEKGGVNKVGPNLWGVLGSDIAQRENFKYSKALESLDGTWTYERLYEFLGAPKSYVPGTSMSFAGLQRQVERINLIAYLRSQSDDPPPIPDPLPEQADAGAAPGGAAQDAAASTPGAAEASAGEDAPAGGLAPTETAPADEDTAAKEAAPDNGGH